jgi:hypothetical protein
MTIKEFAITNQVKMNWRDDAPYNPNFKNADGYMCKLTCDNRQFTVAFYKGSGHNGSPPDLLEVLECLQSDCMSAQNHDVDDFLKELGYSESLESIRNGEKIYKTCLRYAKRLEKLFNSHYNNFLEAESN